MKVLLHICCGPCAIYSIRKLRNRGDIVEGFFYNPNIHPLSEYIKRKESVLRLSALLELRVHFFNGYHPDEFFRSITLREKEKRCQSCWSLRISQTAEYAYKNGFDGFTTTLLISPYQDHEKIVDISQKAANLHSVFFIYEDFRVGFRESHRISNEIGLYHQDYCGCIYSEQERLRKK